MHIITIIRRDVAITSIQEERRKRIQRSIIELFKEDYRNATTKTLKEMIYSSNAHKSTKEKPLWYQAAFEVLGEKEKSGKQSIQTYPAD